MATCDECRWKVERHECPWDFQYKNTDYAEDCIDFRNINWPYDAFKYDERDLKSGKGENMASIYQFAEMKLDNDQTVYLNTQYITSFRYDEEQRETFVDILGEGDLRRAYPGNQTKEILQSLLYVNS